MFQNIPGIGNRPGIWRLVDGSVPGGSVLTRLIDHLTDGIRIVIAGHPVEHHTAHHPLHPVRNPGTSHLRVNDPGEKIQFLLGIVRFRVLLHGLQNCLGRGIPFKIIGGFIVQAHFLDLQISLTFINGPHLQGVFSPFLQSLLDSSRVIHVGVISHYLDILGQPSGGRAPGNRPRSREKQGCRQK